MPSRISIFTLGSRGDTQPFCVLGRALQHAGYEVTLCAPEPYRPFVESFGLKLRPIGTHLAGIKDSEALNAVVRPLLDAAGLHGPWFCFATRMGEVYLLFLADGADDNPPVYFWNEEIDPRIEKGFASFGDWLRSIIDVYKSWQ